MFHLTSSFKPTGDQPQAIDKLVSGIQKGMKDQVLLGVTGSGKTFTMANIIWKLNIPTLIISHNKTLAGQLYQEMRDFFPDNAVSYFVSYYDYYQPEAYIPQSDTYIEKEAQINELIDKLRLKSTANILTRDDVIVVASVSCIYNIGSPTEYGNSIVNIQIGEAYNTSDLARKLIALQYERSEYEFKRGTFRIRGETIDIYPANEDNGYRIHIRQDIICSIEIFEPVSGTILDCIKDKNKNVIIYPAKHYMMNPDVFTSAESAIRNDLAKEHKELLLRGKIVEAERIVRKVNYDLEIIKEVGYVNGIENYSRYFDGRKPGDPPHSLLDFFKAAYKNWLVIIDESHMTVPQLRGMYNGDRSRKRTLIDYGFRLKAALDNRPLMFDEFYKIPKHIIYTSATPDEWELERSTQVVEQLIRPTGIIDPQVSVRPAVMQIEDLILEIEKRVKKGEKIMVTTLTKQTAEDLSSYFKEKKIRAEYLHSDIQTLERSDVLDNLRKNLFDVIIGVNLLREGLDLPEVSLVAILDADKEGFLRSRTSLIQTMGRAARNILGEVILYADTITGSMKRAIKEIERRRREQTAYNTKHHITPATIYKPVREKIAVSDVEPAHVIGIAKEKMVESTLTKIDIDSLTQYDKKKLIKRLEREMKNQAEIMNFEFAIKIRDKIKEIKQ